MSKLILLVADILVVAWDSDEVPPPVAEDADVYPVSESAVPLEVVKTYQSVVKNLSDPVGFFSIYKSVAAWLSG